MLLGRAWNATNLASEIASVDRKELVKKYVEAKRNAPHRHRSGKSFFVEGHDGRLSGNKISGRFEEHLAISLWRLGDTWPRPGGGWLRYLDYQFPLKEALGNEGVGKVDLLGVTEGGRLVVSELKVPPQSGGGRGKSPMDALMQALGYAAIVDANSTDIGKEASRLFAVPSVSVEPPTVQILGPREWWRGWFRLENSTRKATGPWEVRFAELVEDIKRELGIVVECVAINNASKAAISGLPTEPKLLRLPTMFEVRFGGILDVDRLEGKFRTLTKASGLRGSDPA